eukprot:PhF_6_TR9135/c0_g1_i1/m.14207
MWTLVGLAILISCMHSSMTQILCGPSVVYNITHNVDQYCSTLNSFFVISQKKSNFTSDSNQSSLCGGVLCPYYDMKEDVTNNNSCIPLTSQECILRYPGSGRSIYNVTLRRCSIPRRQEPTPTTITPTPSPPELPVPVPQLPVPTTTLPPTPTPTVIPPNCNGHPFSSNLQRCDCRGRWENAWNADAMNSYCTIDRTNSMTPKYTVGESFEGKVLLPATSTSSSFTSLRVIILGITVSLVSSWYTWIWHKADT